MDAPIKTNVVALDDDDVAIPVPRTLGLKPGDSVEVSRSGRTLRVVEAATGDFRERQRELARILLELGPTKDKLGREPIEFPDRPGLY